MQKYSWVIINQSQPPQFQKMLGLLSESLGPGLFITGVRHDVDHPLLTVVEGPQYQRANMKSRLRSWAAFTTFATKKVATLSGSPFLLTVTNPPMLPHLGLLLSRTRGWRTGILVWDLYPDHIVQQGWLSKRNPLVHLWRTLNRLAFNKASVIITLGGGMARAIRAQNPNSDMTIHTIPNWADTESLKPVEKDKNPFVQSQCSSDKITILYSGNLGASHSLDSLLVAAKELDSDPRFEFLIIGEGLSEAPLKAQAKELGLTNLRFLPYQPWDTVPFSLAAADIAVVSQDVASAHLSVPSKTYSALAVGSAILALTSEDSDLANLVTKNKVGLVCDPSNAQGIAQAILKIASDKTTLDNFRKQARSSAEDRYSEAVIREQFELAFHGVTE